MARVAHVRREIKVVAIVLALSFAAAQQFAPPDLNQQSSSSEVVDLAAGVQALRFVVGGDTAAHSTSLLLADATLLGLVMPEERAAFDRLAVQSGSDHALIVLVTATTISPWDAFLRFRQGELRLAARHPFRLRLLEGDPHVVSPTQPVIAVVLLPAEFNLRRPLMVDWGEQSGTITFRR